jgi:hypothetical protein
MINSDISDTESITMLIVCNNPEEAQHVTEWDRRIERGDERERGTWPGHNIYASTALGLRPGKTNVYRVSLIKAVSANTRRQP